MHIWAFRILPNNQQAMAMSIGMAEYALFKSQIPCHATNDSRKGMIIQGHPCFLILPLGNMPSCNMIPYRRLIISEIKYHRGTAIGIFEEDVLDNSYFWELDSTGII